MPLTIRYTDTRNQHEATCDEIQEKAVRDLVENAMHPLMRLHSEYTEFNLLIIDLSGDIEEVTCYKVGDPGRRACSFGGAIAWNIYRAIATIWPEIDYHTSGRPAVIL